MEDNNKSKETEVNGEAYEKHTQYTKQQSFLYTVISVALFFLIYFAVKSVTSTVDRPYLVYDYAEDMSAEQTASVFDISGISQECGFSENIRLEKGSDGYVFTALFLVNALPYDEDDGYESIAEEIISFEYSCFGDDIRTELYPYSENPYYAEYAYAEKYVDIDIPTREIYIFEWDGSLYAGYRQYGSSIPPEIKALFSGSEKVYKS